MIIDAYCHIWERKLMTGDFGRNLDRAVSLLGIRDKDSLLNGSIGRLVDDMDEAGIHKTVILPIDFELLYSESSFTYRDYNNLASIWISPPGKGSSSSQPSNAERALGLS